LLPDARRLTQRSRIRVHVGTAEIMARVTPAADEIAPGSSGIVRLRLEAPLVCRWGDRGVIRSYSPATTTGGFVVVDPWPAARPRRPRDDGGRLSSDPLERVAAFVHSEVPGTVTVDALPVRLGVPPGEVEPLVSRSASADVTVVRGRLFPEAFVAEAAEGALAAVAEFHESHPLEPGMPLEAFRRIAGGGGGSPDVADHVRRELEEAGRIEARSGVVRVTGFAPTLAGPRAQYGEKVQQSLQQAGYQGLTVAELAAEVPAEMARELADFLVRDGTAVRVGTDRYYDRDALADVSRQTVAEIERLGEVSPADLRNALGLSRKYLIPLLEWLDAQGITARVGDARRIGPNARKSL
ncbi:MAG: SelB C-terminal domain-containing protein, partial [bacterium]